MEDGTNIIKPAIPIITTPVLPTQGVLVDFEEDLKVIEVLPGIVAAMLQRKYCNLFTENQRANWKCGDPVDRDRVGFLRVLEHICDSFSFASFLNPEFVVIPMQLKESFCITIESRVYWREELEIRLVLVTDT